MTALGDPLMNGYGVLERFDNRDVIGSTIAVTNAGDGLSKALAVEPQEFHLGQRVFVVLETVVGKVTFQPIKDTDALRRVHTLVTEGATIVDASIVKVQLDEQADKIARAREAAQGVQRIPFDDAGEDDEGAVLARHHAAGLHAERMTGCEACETEAMAEAAGE